jgi:hypothetical protein
MSEHINRIFHSTLSLRQAVNLWCSKRFEAEAKWGHISQWNVSDIIDMSNLFEDKVDFNDDISDWDVRNVTDMSNMFSGAVNFNQSLFKWKISAETNRENMFAGADAYNSWKGMSQILTLDCCLYSHDIPVELRQILHSFYFKPLEIVDISDAVENWSSNQKYSESRYGHISGWYINAVFTKESLTIDQCCALVEGLADVSSAVDYREVVREAGFVRCAVDLLSDADVDVRYNALLICRYLCDFTETQIAMRELGAINVAVKLLSDSDENIRDQAAMVLCRSSLEESNEDFIRVAGGIHALMKCLSDSDAGVRGSSLLAFYNLAYNDQNALLLRESGGIELMN